MLKNMAVLVTGAAGSLGSATAKKLISEGCKVTLLDLPDSKGAEVANDLGENALFSPGSITSNEDVTKALDLITEKFGYLRGVVNCAGVHRITTLCQSTDKTVAPLEPIEEIFKVNVLGTMNVIRLSLTRMMENPVDKNDSRGIIINTSGYGATEGHSGQVGLAGAWGAISSMTLPLCRELGTNGLRVMTISPGLFDSNLLKSVTLKRRKAIHAITPFPKRFGYKEEFADLVIAIMKNNFLNGEVIRLDGGLRLFL